MTRGYLALILHAHLPYVRHPEHDGCLEEDWFYEAVTETYLPLLDSWRRLADEGVPFSLTMSISPPLLSMFLDPLLMSRFERRLESLIELSGKEVTRTAWQPEYNGTARLYQARLQRARQLYVDELRRDIVAGFRGLQDRGRLEIITCPATHAYLPLVLRAEAVRAQLQAALSLHEKHFGRPRGIWLSECGYQPGQDELLREAGLRYFCTDAHGVLHATPRPKYGIYAPIFCPSGVAAFGRDMESSKQVWSADEGYPGDYDYREFYRDIGHDLDYEYIRPYLGSHGIRTNTGLKYHRITGRTADKQPYVHWIARERAATHAGNFMFNREKQVEYLSGILDRAPIVVAPYDAELFGHWWYEGPEWLEFLLRKLAYDQNTLKTISPGEYLRLHPKNQVSTPSMSSWGYKGYSEVWLEGSNDWIYPHLHMAADRLIELAEAHPYADGLLARALNQAARELLLAQSSDWAFIMKTGTMVPYAVKRTRDHLGRFNRLYDQIVSGEIEEGFLREIEAKDNIFPDLSYTWYRPDYRIGSEARLLTTA
ncbi:MAG: glycoside hydrolase family 57 protein [Patescibacteria group bacterium]